MDPYCAGAHQNLGVVKFQEGLFAESIQHLLNAYQIDPEHRGLVLNLSAVLQTAGQHEKAWDLMLKLIKKNPGDIEVLTAISNFVKTWQQAEGFSGSPLQMDGRGFRALVSGKRVALVGPAGYLQGSEQGEWIDSFDLVVRVNRGIIEDPQSFKDIGKRTDVLYTCMAASTHEGPVDLDLWERVGLKAVVIKNTFAHRKDKESFERQNHKIPFHYIENELTSELIRKMGISNPHMGTTAIYHLLHCGVAQLYLTGFTFYQTPQHYMPAYREWDDKAVRERAQYHKHESRKEFEYFLSVLAGGKRIQPDKVLSEIVLAASEKG